MRPDPVAVLASRERRQRSAAAIVQSRQHARFAHASDELGSLLPPAFDPGATYHVISNGDIDALSFAKHVLAGAAFDALILSSWAVAMPAIEYLQSQVNAGRLRRIDAYVGEIMPRDRPHLYAALCALVAATSGRVMVLRNHAKAWMFLADDGRCTVIETSANANYNKRIEQSVISAAPQVAATYKLFFDALDVPTPTFPDWTPHGWPPAAAQ